MAAGKKQRLSFVDALSNGAVAAKPESTVLVASAFDYSVIADKSDRTFLGEQAIEIKHLLVDSLRLHQKAEEILDQSTQSLVEAGRRFQVARDRLGRGKWGRWLKDEFSQTFVDIGVITPDELSPLTIERKVQELMQFAKTIDLEPEHQDLMKLSNVKPYLLARLTAPSTPDEARSEVVAQIQQAEAEQKPLPTTKAIRATVARYNPKPSETKAKLARSLSATTAKTNSTSRSTSRSISPSPAKAVEIVSVVPASSPAVERLDVGAIEIPTAPKIKIKPRHLYLCGKHVVFSGPHSDPRWLAALPRAIDKDGSELFDLLTDYSNSQEPVVMQVGGQIFAACENLDLLSEILEEWSLVTGKEVIENSPRH